MARLRFNKVCEVEDFSHPELVTALQQVRAHRLAELPLGFPAGCEDRRDWESAMSFRALVHAAGVDPAATVLALAVRDTDLLFHLARRSRHVVAADRYLDSFGRPQGAFSWMLLRPEDGAPFPVDPDRLVAAHMDPRSLRYPDETFDAVVAGPNIMLSRLSDAAHASYEMGRVLKPGGVVSLVVDLRLAGPPGGTGWSTQALLSPAHVMQFVVAASGLEPVDQASLEPSQATLATPRGFSFSGVAVDAGPDRDDDPRAGYPSLVMVRDGYVMTSAHLTLKKTEGYPCVPNQWAAPSLGASRSASVNRDSVGLR